MTERRIEPWIVVMAGGSGKRFWPLSRKKNPKQALCLFSSDSLLEETLARVRPLTGPGQVLVNTSRQLRSRLEKVCGSVGWIEEPLARDTAPCVALSAAWVVHRAPEGVLVLLPADHYIPDAEAFRQVLSSAVAQASETGDIVTVGIRPTRPDTGYGYIEMGDALSSDSYRVRAFVEKPDLARAAEYLASGRYLWNGGIFVARASVLLDAFRQHQPGIGAGIDRMLASDLSAEVVAQTYASLEPISFDHAIMEKVTGVRVLPAHFAWDDVGSWLSLERVFGAESVDSNVVRGRHVGLDTQRCVVLSKGYNQLVATLGVEDLVVVQTESAVLVAHKNSLGQLKPLLGKMQEQGLEDWL